MKTVFKTLVSLLFLGKSTSRDSSAHLAVQVLRPVEPASMVVCASSKVIAFSSESGTLSEPAGWVGVLYM